MTTAAGLFGTSTALTCTLAALATSSTRLVGRVATAVDLSGISPVPIDVMVGGKITTGTSPTAGIIEIWASGSEDGTNYAAGLATSDAGATLVAETKGLLRLVASIATNNTSNTTYIISPVSLLGVFGGVLPRKFTLWVTHSTAVNLHATGGNHALSFTPVNYAS